MWENMGEVWGEMWKSVWGECGGCGEVGKSVLECGEVWRSVWGKPTHSFIPFSLLTRHLFPHSPDTSPPHPPHSPETSVHIFPHSLPTSPHVLTLPLTPPPFLSSPTPLPTLTSLDTFISPPPTLPHTHFPYFLTTPTTPPTLPHTPYTLPFATYQNFCLFSFIAKLV